MADRSRLSTVGGWGLVRTADPRSINAVAAPGTNVAFYMRVIGAGTISKVALVIGTQGGNISVAAYQNNGLGRAGAPSTLLASSGSVACPASGYAEVSLGASVTLAEGDWLAVSCSSSAATIGCVAATVVANGLAKGAQYAQVSAHPLPSSPSSLLDRSGGGFVLIGVP